MQNREGAIRPVPVVSRQPPSAEYVADLERRFTAEFGISGQEVIAYADPRRLIRAVEKRVAAMRAQPGLNGNGAATALSSESQPSATEFNNPNRLADAILRRVKAMSRGSQ
jgi:hypothetical protein